VDPSVIGRTYPATEPYRVSREKIAEFADAINDPNPMYRDPAAAQRAGYPDVIAPPTFPIILTLAAGRQAILDPQLKIDYARVVHGEQRFVHNRPVHAGDELQVVVSIEDVRTAAGNDIVTTRGDVSTPDGEHVLTAYSTIVARGPAS
jgi:acyl dehydratase